MPRSRKRRPAAPTEGAPPSLGLADLERRVREAVTRGEGLPGILEPLAAFRPGEQVGIYHEGWFARLLGILKDDFPATAAAAGAKGFAPLARAYLEAHPPRDPNITWVGDGFAAFLAGRRGLARRAFLSDLARLEWAVTSIFDRADGPVLDIDALREAGAGRIAAARFPRASTAELLEFRHPVNAYLDAVRRGGRPRVPAPARTAVLVSRAGTQVRRMELPREALAALKALYAGKSLSAAVDAAGRAAGRKRAADLPSRVTAWFGEWVANGAFAPAVVPGGRAPMRRKRGDEEE
ncbi:MAG TPA: putative DNA-binding domain-containing protein [Planctomycetota bacterium]|nr:putative DNA-binding domain-containing protein [Planctomycetota bacterium]